MSPSTALPIYATFAPKPRRPVVGQGGSGGRAGWGVRRVVGPVGRVGWVGRVGGLGGRWVGRVGRIEQVRQAGQVGRVRQGRQHHAKITAMAEPREYHAGESLEDFCRACKTDRDAHHRRR